MSEAKFTPGPWVAEEIGVTDMGPNGTLVFEVLTADGYRRIVDAAGEGDARLIAAAPEMLQALSLVRMSAGWQYLSDESRAVIDAAIAKATGAAS